MDKVVCDSHERLGTKFALGLGTDMDFKELEDCPECTAIAAEAFASVEGRLTASIERLRRAALQDEEIRLDD